MKRGRTNKRTITSFLSTGLLALALGACASSGSSGQKGAEKTVTHVEKLSAELALLSTDLGTTNAAIDVLRNSYENEGVFDRTKVATGDIEAGYKQYRSALGDARGAVKDVESARTKLNESMTAFVQAWEADLAQVQSQSLREASLERRAKAQERYAEVSDEFGALWEKIQAHVTHLGDIELTLGADLTPAGVSAIDDELGSAQDEHKEIQEGLGEATKLLNGFAQSIRASAPAPAEAPKA